MKKYENFCSALANLEAAIRYGKPYDDIQVTGVVGKFQICFELAWKLMKEVEELHGATEYESSTPRMVITTAWQWGIAEDAGIWTDMLRNRNVLVHTYNGVLALEVIQKIKTSYFEAFVKLKAAVEEKYMQPPHFG